MIDLGPMLIAATVHDRKLSMRVLGVTLGLLNRKESDALEKNVEIGDGKSESLLDLSIQVAVQSYEVATTKYDEVALRLYDMQTISRGY